MAERAFHSAPMFFLVLVAHQTNGGAPLRKACLIRAAVAHRTCCYVSHIRPVVRLGISGMAHGAIRSRLMVEGMTSSTNLHARTGACFYVTGRTAESHLSVGLMGEAPDGGDYRPLGRTVMAEEAVRCWDMVEAMTGSTVLLPYRHGRGLMAGVTPKTHSQMGIVEKGPGGKRNGVARRGIVTKPAGPGRIGDVVAVVAALGGRHGQTTVFGHGGMTGLAIESGIHSVPAMGECSALPVHHSPSVNPEMTGSTRSNLQGLAQVHRSQTWIDPSRLGSLPCEPHRGSEKFVGEGYVVRSLPDRDQLQVFLSGPNERIGSKGRPSPQGLANLPDCPGDGVHPHPDLLLPARQDPGKFYPMA